MRTLDFRKTLAVLGCTAFATGAFAQANWLFECWDFANVQNPVSNTWNAYALGNDLVRIDLGLSGTLTYFGTNGPCFTPQATLNARGRFGYMSGPTGSVQSDFDDNLVYTFGMPLYMGGGQGYATTTRNGTQTLVGANGFSLAFVGASDRYFLIQTTNDSTFVELRADVVGDAVRMQWTLTNRGTEAAGLGIWLGHIVAMLTDSPGKTDTTGASESHAFIFGNSGYRPKEGYIYRDGGRQIRTMQRLNRAQDPANFPKFVDFLFGQTAAYGFRVENGPTASTTPPNGVSDATDASEIVFYDAFMSPPPLGGIGGDGPFQDVIIPDTLIDETAYVQKFGEQQVAPNASRQIVHYVRSTWGVSNYSKPYAVVMDAPGLLATSSSGQDGLAPNPFRVRIYVDNIRGFTTVDQEVPLNDVRITLTLPAGMSFAGGDTAVKIIPIVPPKQIRYVEYTVASDGRVFGNLPITVKVEPTPGPVKEVTGTVNVSATPRLTIREGANLVSVPWSFSDTTWSSILGMTPVVDFNAYAWNPQLLGYTLSSSAERGKAAWIVSNLELGSHQLLGAPTVPTDTSSGGLLNQLKSGWNLVGNPYPYAIQLGAINGVSAANPDQAYSWEQLVQLGYVSGEVAYWDETTQSYKFIQGNDGIMQPNRGYWMHVNTVQDFTLSWPPVNVPFLPGSSRAPQNWRQTSDQWRLKLVARTNDSMDDENYVGVARSAAEAKTLAAVNPPMGPTQKVDVMIADTANGKPTRMAGAYVDRATRHEWDVEVNVKEAGRVTLSWPNLSTVPMNVRFRLVDKATGVARDLRQSSGYTFDANEPGVRSFSLQMEPGTAQRAVIGNVVVSRPSRDAAAPFTIAYTLSTNATTSIRILSGTGKEVFSVSRGRSDAAGQNTAVWMLRDNANRAVAPGTYRVEILAEATNGERVRKTVPINVIR